MKILGYVWKWGCWSYHWDVSIYSVPFAWVQEYVDVCLTFLFAKPRFLLSPPDCLEIWVNSIQTPCQGLQRPMHSWDSLSSSISCNLQSRCGLCVTVSQLVWKPAPSTASYKNSIPGIVGFGHLTEGWGHWQHGQLLMSSLAPLCTLTFLLHSSPPPSSGANTLFGFPITV